jgi:hypothetical protein
LSSASLGCILSDRKDEGVAAYGSLTANPGHSQGLRGVPGRAGFQGSNSWKTEKLEALRSGVEAEIARRLRRRSWMRPQLREAELDTFLRFSKLDTQQAQQKSHKLLMLMAF